MTKLAQLRQFISNFVDGPNTQALLGALADQLQKQEDLSIAVNNQLTIMTSSGNYTDKRLAELGITRPSELGMEDLAFKQMGIQINQAKQITEAIHTVLATFYGDETVRAYTTSGIAGPYSFATGDDLIFTLESGEQLTLTLLGDEFENAQNATPEELAGVITRYIRSFGSDGYAQVFLDVDTGLKYIRIFGGAKGPYSLVQILGGRIQSQLEFPTMRDTFLAFNTTVWEITRNIGSRHRFRWTSGPKPKLDQVLVGDKVMIYGPQFESVGFVGSFDVKQVSPGGNVSDPASGYFEIEIEGTSPLASSLPDVPAPPNAPGLTYTITVTQNSYDDLKFFQAKKSTPYAQARYALAWEPADSLLRVYMPATTKVVKRDLVGSAHLHLLYGAQELNGSFGHATVDDQKLIITSDYGFKYRQNGLDCQAFGGTITYGMTSIDIDYIWRENGYTHVITTTPHGITGIVDSFGRVLSTTVVGVTVGTISVDDPTAFLGPYLVDPSAPYTLTDTVVKLREKITAGETKRSLLVEGTLPDTTGSLLFGLNQETQESPVQYLSSQSTSSILPISISTISQLSTTVTVTTITPHGAVLGQTVLISGTTNFNGTWTVASVPAGNVYTFTKTPSAVLYETSGISQALVGGAISTLMMNTAYVFNYTHEVGTDITLLSDSKAYEPALDGTDYSFYMTGTAQGRVFAEELIRSITALGIRMEIIILYPNDNGLGNEGDSDSYDNPPTSDKVYVWGGD